MSDFLLHRTTGAVAFKDEERSSADTARYGEYVLRHFGRGFSRVGDTGIYIGGYVMPRNDLFRQYDAMGPHDLVASLYTSYGKSFTDHVKGCFIVIIMKEDRVEIFFDHLGLFRAFYHSAPGRFLMAGTVTRLLEAGVSSGPDRVSLAMQALFHRVPGHFTVYKEISKSGPADYFRLEGGTVNQSAYFKPGDLTGHESVSQDVETEEFATLFRSNVINLNKYFNPESTLITLTGGKDSRTILAALLGAGIKPSGFTYGNPLSRDAVYAGKTARKAGICHATYNPPATREWFSLEAGNIIAGGDPEINIHRSHRRYAFAMAAAAAGRETAFYAGYMGGELLMGIYYDDLIFTDFLKNIWNGLPAHGSPAKGLSANGSPAEQLIYERLRAYFIRPDRQFTGAILERISGMASTDVSLTRQMREFHGLFEIGIPHHAQDINLSLSYWNYPCPAYLDIEFLMLLFRSRQSFLYRDASTTNPVKRHNLFSINMRLQHLLYPELDSVPFGKRGSYSNSEYLLGPVPWSIIKGFRYLTERRGYPSSFIYGSEYGEFLEGALGEIAAAGSPARDLYDVDQACASLEKLNFPLTEKHLHKYSDIVTFNMMFGNR